MDTNYIKKLEDPYYLPPRDEVLSEISKNSYPCLHSASCAKLWYEVITQDLIQWLTSHLSSYVSKNTSTKILEVCAWQGRLAHFLKQSLLELYGNLFEVRAIDNGLQSWEVQLPIVENLSMDEAIATYKPNIIIASWLPMHPHNLLSDEFLSRFDALKRKNPKTSEENIELSQLFIKFQEICHGPDITASRRKNPELQEYLLIWPVAQVWLSTAIKKIHGCSLATPEFSQDGFERKKLPISCVNTWNLESWFADADYLSEVYSFTRVK